MVSGVVGVLETGIMVFDLKQVVNLMICRIGLTGGVDCRAWCWNKDWAYPAYGNVSNTFTILLLGHMACGTFLWVITMGWSLNDVAVAVSRFSFSCCDRRLITGFNGFHFSLETRALWDLLGIKEKPVGVSVVATVASWMYKANHPKIIQHQIIPFHVLPSSGLKEPILVWGWDWKLDIFGVQFCSRPFHVSRLLLTMQIWVWKVVAENGGQLCSTTLAFCLVVCSHIYHIPLFSQAMFLLGSHWYSKPKHSYVNCCNCFSALHISFG